MKYVYTLRRTDVGHRWLRIRGRVRENPIGVTLPGDIGKRIYEHTQTGALQCENDAQRDARALAQERACKPLWALEAVP
jgi:hypothetical protein